MDPGRVVVFCFVSFYRPGCCVWFRSSSSLPPSYSQPSPPPKTHWRELSKRWTPIREYFALVRSHGYRTAGQAATLPIHFWSKVYHGRVKKIVERGEGGSRIKRNEDGENEREKGGRRGKEDREWSEGRRGGCASEGGVREWKERESESESSLSLSFSV